MLGKRIDSLLLLLVAGSLQGGCFLSRGVSEDIVPVNLEAHDLTPVPRDVEISMAAALLTVESGADWIRHSITGAGPEVEAMKKGMRDGLVRANPSFRPTDQTTVAIPTICSLDVGAAGATSLTDARSCILPSQLPPLTSDDPSMGSGRHLLLLLRGKTERIRGDVDLQLGVAPGYGGVAPFVAGGATHHYIFSLVARIYDQETGRMLAEGSATTRGFDQYVFLYFLPMSIDVADQERNYLAMGRALGSRFGQVLQMPK